MSDPAKTIVLVHGLWVTPTSWAKFKSYYESRGYEVIASPWPGVNKDAAALRRDSSSLHGIGIAEVVSHYGSRVIDCYVDGTRRT